jgi:hypothetical protein
MPEEETMNIGKAIRVLKVEPIVSPIAQWAPVAAAPAAPRAPIVTDPRR